MEESGRHTIAVLIAALLWGTTGTVAHYAPHGARGVLIGAATFGFGGLLLTALDLRRVVPLVRRPGTWPMLGAGMLGVLAYAGCYYWSMSLVGVAIGNAVALGSGPVFAAVLELTVERRPVRRWWVVATAASVAGIVTLGASAGARTGPHPAAGVALGAVSGAGYGLYSWAAGRLIGAGHPSRPVMAGVFGLAAVVLVPAFFLAGPGPLLSGRGAGILGYLAVVPMAAAYLLFGYGLRGLTASTATGLALAEPLVATSLAVLVLHEHLGAGGWTGLVLIGAGIVISVARQRARPASGPHEASTADSMTVVIE